MSRKTVDDHQSIPSWTSSNAFLSEQNLPVATTCYLPFIRAPPTYLTTTYAILLRLVQIADKLDQSHILVTAECAIYSKAQHILWNKLALLDGKVTMRLGGMHVDMAYISSIRNSTEMVVFCPCWLTPMYTLQRRQDSCLKGNRCREETAV